MKCAICGRQMTVGDSLVKMIMFDIDREFENGSAILNPTFSDPSIGYKVCIECWEIRILTLF